MFLPKPLVNPRPIRVLKAQPTNYRTAARILTLKRPISAQVPRSLYAVAESTLVREKPLLGAFASTFTRRHDLSGWRDRWCRLRKVRHAARATVHPRLTPSSTIPESARLVYFGQAVRYKLWLYRFFHFTNSHGRTTCLGGCTDFSFTDAPSAASVCPLPGRIVAQRSAQSFWVKARRLVCDFLHVEGTLGG